MAVERSQRIFGKAVASPTDNQIWPNQHAARIHRLPKVCARYRRDPHNPNKAQYWPLECLRPSSPRQCEATSPGFAAVSRNQREALFSGKVERGHDRSGQPVPKPCMRK